MLLFAACLVKSRNAYIMYTVTMVTLLSISKHHKLRRFFFSYAANEFHKILPYLGTELIWNMLKFMLVNKPLTNESGLNIRRLAAERLYIELQGRFLMGPPTRQSPELQGRFLSNSKPKCVDSRAGICRFKGRYESTTGIVMPNCGQKYVNCRPYPCQIEGRNVSIVGRLRCVKLRA